MGLIGYKSVDVVNANNESKVIPEGFQQAAFKNLSTAGATLTQDGKSWTLPAGETFNLPLLDGNDGWKAVSINATGTIVECVYF